MSQFVRHDAGQLVCVVARVEQGRVHHKVVAGAGEGVDFFVFYLDMTLESENGRQDALVLDSFMARHRMKSAPD